MLLVLKNPLGDAQSTIFNTLIRDSIEETSASVIITTQSQNQLADSSSLTALPDQRFTQNEEFINTLDSSTVQENSLQALNPASTDYINSFRADQVVRYTVQAGDTISSLAADFDISINSIILANNLRNPNTLSLGTTLIIPPVTGVIHTVKKGDTIASIAKKYKAESSQILSFNNLTDDQLLEVGNELMVPGGELPGPIPSVKSVPRGSGASGIYVPVGNGQCVDFVQAHGHANRSGNAYTWKKYINPSFNLPTIGGVVVFKGGRYGHVALITAVKEGSIQVVEQNYYGPYIIDHREISLNDRLIVGFIQ